MASVTLYDPEFPVFTQEFPRADFDRKLEENPLNEQYFLPDMPQEQAQPTNTRDYGGDYRLLDRLCTDCEYFLGAGHRNEKHLWAGNVSAQIHKMRELYDTMPEKPDWLTMEQIEDYADRMAARYQVAVYHHFENGFDERLDYQTLEEAERVAQGYVDGTIGTLAASSEEEALGEINIYNGNYELGYLFINGAVQKQKYTYYNYQGADGSTQEIPAYCVNPNQYGVPQTVGPGQSIKYLANEKTKDPKIVSIVFNGYPHKSLGELGLDNKYQAYYATKMALWCYIIPGWDINSLKVAPGLSGTELTIGNNTVSGQHQRFRKAVFLAGSTMNGSSKNGQ